MGKRLLGVLLMVLLLCAVAAPVMAVEAEGEEPEHQEMPSYEEVGSGSETSQEFRPVPYEQPSVFTGMLYPLMILAGVAVLAVLGLYLLWQPRFSQEREQREKKGR